MTRKTRVILTIFVIVGLLVNTGCWSRREMEGLAYILVLGIDRAENGNIKVVAQVGLPIQDPGGGGGDEPAVQLLGGEGRDISEAMDELFRNSTKRPFLSHLRLIIFSEELAEEGLAPALDFIRRDIRIRLNTKVAVTTDDIEELLEIENPLSTQPALAIIDQFSINMERSRAVRAEIMDLVSNVVETDRQAVMPIIVGGEDRFELGETAVFDGDKMVVIAERDETFGLIAWQNRIRSGVVTVTPNSEEYASMRIVSSTTRVDTRWEDGKLFVQARVNSVLELTELQMPLDELSVYASHYFVSRMQGAMALAQEEGTDFLNISARFRRQHPEIWREIQEDWPQVLQEAEVDIRSSAKVRRQGQIP